MLVLSRICRPHGGMSTAQDEILNTLTDWVADPTCQGNAMTLTVAGIVFANEEKFVEALKACHTGLSLEMCVCISLLAPCCHPCICVA